MKLLAILLATTLATSPHDIASLQPWGPYSKEYYGISHISDLDSSLKVEFLLVPGQNRTAKVPCALFETDVHPWKVTPDMAHITYRHEIEWKDRMYVDATWHILDSTRVLLETKCVNNTDLLQNFNLQLAARKCVDPEVPASNKGRQVPLEELAPQMETAPGSVLLKYPGIDCWYGVAWNYSLSCVRQWRCSKLEHLLPLQSNNRVYHEFNGDRKGHFTANFLAPIELAPHTDTTLMQLLVCGTKDYVAAQLKAFNADEKQFRPGAEPATASALPAAAEYAFGEQIIEATLQTNVVYPINAFGLPIRHFCPGKCWNSLYTWDCGFIAWAMGMVNPQRGYEIIRQYTTTPDEEAHFVHHGTPLAIQIMAIGDVLTAGGCSEAQMSEIYPRLKRFYNYMTGPDFRLPSGLLATWKIFYNSGGWDDYPPQAELRPKKELRARTAPMVSTAYYIRCAKILRLMASHLGLKADVKAFDADIAALSRGILDNAWDPETGYFSYVEHSPDGKPLGIYRTGQGANFNMGLDGVAPLVAGIGSQEQTDAMFAHIFTPGELWSPCGITAVDQRAPYYRHDGYWNGTVWFPHQLIIWKTMLDMGHPERARQIAITALDKWKGECAYSYNSCEQFVIRTGRGDGWFNFSGLSSPAVNWYHSYFVPGTVTTGFGTLLTKPVWNSEFTSFSAQLEFEPGLKGKTTSIVAVVAPGHTYSVKVGGREATFESPYDGLLEISFKPGSKPSQICIEALDNTK